MTVQSIQTTLSGTPNSIYENKNYKIVVGLPPKSPNNPEPTPAYLIVNKETGVMEDWMPILFYAKQNADLFDKMLTGEPVETPIEIADEEIGKKTKKNKNLN